MVMYEYDSNVILYKPETICDAFLNMHRILNSRGRITRVYIMVNEYSINLKDAMKNALLTSNLPHLTCTGTFHQIRQLELARLI